MFKCLNKWNNFNDLDGYCNGEPEMESEPVYAEVDTKKILPRYWIDWLNKSEERKHLIHN